MYAAGNIQGIRIAYLQDDIISLKLAVVGEMLVTASEE
jgi:hypothetical protein